MGTETAHAGVSQTFGGPADPIEMHCDASREGDGVLNRIQLIGRLAGDP